MYSIQLHFSLMNLSIISRHFTFRSNSFYWYNIRLNFSIIVKCILISVACSLRYIWWNVLLLFLFFSLFFTLINFQYNRLVNWRLWRWNKVLRLIFVLNILCFLFQILTIFIYLQSHISKWFELIWGFLLAWWISLSQLFIRWFSFLF